MPTLSPVVPFAAGLFRDKGPPVNGDVDPRHERRLPCLSMCSTYPASAALERVNAAAL